MSVCLESERDAAIWTAFLGQAVRFLTLYSHLADAFILDFFVQDSWRTIPESWQAALDRWSAQQLSAFIGGDREGDSKQDGNSVWPPAEVAPLSLLAYRAACRALSLPRRPIASPRPVAEFLSRRDGSGAAQDDDGVTSAPDPPAGAEPGQHDPLVRPAPARSGGSEQAARRRPGAGEAESWPADASAELAPGGGQLKLLEHVFRRHVKPKKQHELRRLARLTELTRPGLVVDLGSGRGHLSRFLAYSCRLPVVCLESNAEFVTGARKLDAELEKTVRKREGFDLPPPPLHLACHITESMDHQTFAETLSRLTGRPAGSLRFTALGLHTCGDLAALQLRQFARSPQCGAVVSVGCCYMKLSTPAAGWRGYPLSAALAAEAARHGYVMSYEAREMACHAIEEYADRLSRGGEQTLKIHAYRAALERALVALDPSLRRAGLRGVNKGHTLPFHEYVAKAVSRLSLDPARLDLAPASVDLAHWRRVVAFYSLRLMLAPVVESVLLLDRMLYLWENGHPSILVPAFDPKLSPRNFVLIAKKH